MDSWKESLRRELLQNPAKALGGKHMWGCLPSHPTCVPMVESSDQSQSWFSPSLSELQTPSEHSHLTPVFISCRSQANIGLRM